jgi:hypothetical protein
MRYPLIDVKRSGERVPEEGRYQGSEEEEPFQGCFAQRDGKLKEIERAHLYPPPKK